MGKYFLLALGAIVFLIYWIVRSKREQERTLRNRLSRQFGELPNKEYDYTEFQSISHYYLRHKGSAFSVDDITWNDLDMDKVFMMLNNTQSSAGAEYLYKLLRTPCFDGEELKERDRLMEYLDGNEEVRQELQKLFWNMGHTKHISLADYIGNFVDLKTRGKAPHYICIALLAASIGVMCVNVSIGMLVFIGVVVYNVMRYFQIKAEVESYFICTAYIARLVNCACRLGERKDEELAEYERILREASEPLTGIVFKAKLIGPVNSFSGGVAEMIMEYVRMVFHLDLLKFNEILEIVKKHTDEIETMLAVIGKLEACIAIASYRRTLPYYAKPQLLAREKENYLCAVDLYHPLVQNPVANCIEENRCVLLTGSNASGKSTFLKTVALNAILAQTIYTVMAADYKSCYYKVMSSMALKDSLETKESYYMVEIRSLKRIMQEKQDDYPVMCFVDEVLRGTNTVERVAASSRILQSLSKSGAMCFAATHDIELTHLLEKEFANYHFREEVKDDDILFNYILNKGRATTRNAIKLLSIMGYDEAVIKRAEETAKRFLETGIWSMQ